MPAQRSFVTPSITSSFCLDTLREQENSGEQTRHPLSNYLCVSPENTAALDHKAKGRPEHTEHFYRLLISVMPRSTVTFH